MKATPYSQRPYFPYLLANGNDALLLNHSGAMISGVTGHTHNEQNQGAICAWYKQEQRERTGLLQPLVIAGYQVEIGGEVCEIIDFEQEFCPAEATLTTLARFRRGTELRISAFLSDSGVLALHFEVLKAAADLALAFLLLSPNSVHGTLTPHTCPKREFTPVPDGLDFSYEFDGIRGGGVLRSDRTGGVPREYIGTIGMGIRYAGIASGWCGTMYVSCADAPALPVTDYADLRAKHLAGWRAYFAASSVALPDAELQYAYELSRYLMRANMHASGALPAGQLPYLWHGGICVPFDAEVMQHALLQGNNFAEARHHLDFYLDRFASGCELAREIGLKGFAFSNWSDVFGSHLGGDLKFELLKRKPLMIAIIGIAAGNCRRYSEGDDPDAVKLLLGCADFIESGFVRDGKIVACIAGNESDVEVERDSMMLATSCRLFELASELCGDARRGRLAASLRNELEKNRAANGVLMPYSGADYTAGEMTLLHYLIADAADASGLAASLKALETPWGIDNDQPSEVYRHWPWNDCLYARSFACAGDGKSAFPFLKRWFDHAASSGASPEKIRLDGYPIGYWYPTPYALYLLALYAALADFDAAGKLKLLYGFDGEWRELSANEIRLPGGLAVSLRVSGGKLEELSLFNAGEEKTFVVDLNPIYGKLETDRISLARHGRVTLKGGRS